MITPNTEQQILPTKNRALFNDIIIKAAPGSTDYIGINNVYINEDGNLIICYSTGEEDNVGHVVGADGKDGVDGTSGIDGKTPYIKDGNWWIDDVDLGIKAEGKDGINGEDGEPGKSAYQIAQDKGFEGSEEEWLESLKSETEGKQDIFIINATTSGETYAIDKTYAEILDAVNTNKQIIVWTNSDVVGVPTEIQVEDNEILFAFLDLGFITFVSISSANVIETQVTYLADGETIGELGNLKTTDTSSIVAAINELVDNMGDIETALDGIISIQNALIGGDESDEGDEV